MRGRRPIGPEVTDHLDGSAQARLRMRLILETLAGTTRKKDTCAALRICAQRFEALRAEAIGAGIAALEPRPPGRPRRAAPARDAEVARLEARVVELEAELQAAQARAELAGHLPRRGRVAGKSRPRSDRAKESHRSRPGHSTSTN